MDIGVIAAPAARLGAAPAITGRQRGRAGKPPRGPLRRRDETGGVVSLWVVLMVPVSAFAAVVAMAGPQRLAAESSMSEAANDMATMAVAERYVQEEGKGQLTAFPLDCDHLSPDWSTEQARLTLDEEQKEQAEADARNEVPPDPNKIYAAELAHDDAAADLAAFNRRLDDWREACEFLEESIVRDLGNLGVDVGSLRGFYSDSLTESSQSGTCSDPLHSTQNACTGAGGTWLPVLCKISEKVVVQDAVHVALAADWQDAGWAAAQVWPDGRRLGAESIGRRARAVAAGGGSVPIPTVACENQLDVLDSYGRPVVLQDPSHLSRQLSETSETRTPLSG